MGTQHVSKMTIEQLRGENRMLNSDKERLWVEIEAHYEQCTKRGVPVSDPVDADACNYRMAGRMLELVEDRMRETFEEIQHRENTEAREMAEIRLQRRYDDDTIDLY